jgi:single-stranded-DNA-specific exonuclease
MIVADYDCDGATACAVGLRALSAFGASVDYFVPNRFETGYGLSREVVDLVAPARPDLLITVDNGIASVEGVERARELGIGTLITDHHLPGDELPAAECIVNPSQPGCAFPSKSIAGVGVMFYVMLALAPAAAGAFREDTQPGSMPCSTGQPAPADVVRLDRNNRILVAGLPDPQRPLHAGIGALFQVAGRDERTVRASDLASRSGRIMPPVA